MNYLDDPLSRNPVKNCVVLPKLGARNDNGMSSTDNENNSNWDTTKKKKSYKSMRPKPININLDVDSGVPALNMDSKDNFSFHNKLHSNSNMKGFEGSEGEQQINNQFCFDKFLLYERVQDVFLSISSFFNYFFCCY